MTVYPFYKWCVRWEKGRLVNVALVTDVVQARSDNWFVGWRFTESKEIHIGSFFIKDVVAEPWESELRPQQVRYMISSTFESFRKFLP